MPLGPQALHYDVWFSSRNGGNKINVGHESQMFCDKSYCTNNVKTKKKIKR